MDMRKNEKGSSLIFALAVISIITMVIAACMAISYSYYNRSIVDNSERQAYLTAKSVATYVVNDILSGSEDFVPTEDNKTIPLNVAGVPIEMGIIDKNASKISITEDKIEIKQDDKIEKKEVEKITVSVTAVYGNKTKTVNADLMQYKGENQNWQLREYYEGIANTQISPNMKNKDNLENYINSMNIFENYGTMGKDEKKAAALEVTEGKYKDIYEEALKNAIAADDKNFKITDSSISNDNLRKLFFYGVFGSMWPEYDFSY